MSEAFDQLKAEQVGIAVIEFETCRCARWAAAREVIRGKRRDLANDEVFLTPSGAPVARRSLTRKP